VKDIDEGRVMSGKFRSFDRRLALLRGLTAIVTSVATAAAWGGGISATATDKGGAKMADVVVYATPVGGASIPAADALETVTIAQDQLQFSPYVTAIRTGTAIKFPNYDKIEHHVKSFSSAKEFEIKVYEKGTPPPVVFDKPGVVIVYCMFHGWMRAYVMVVDTPYFATAEASGAVNLDKLKEGLYEVRAWHPDMGAVKPVLMQTVKVGANGTHEVAFDFDFIAKKRKPAKRGAGEKH
jgi:plastocyanin